MSQTTVLAFPNILNQFRSDIDMFDFDENLCIYNYKQCDDQTSEELKNIRGLIIDNKTGIPIFNKTGCIGIPMCSYTEEYTSVPSNLDITKYKIYDSEEGSIIKVYYFATHWYVSTTKKLNAFTCKWGSNETFGDNFERALGRSIDVLVDSLDKNNMYLFLLRNTKNTRLVSHAPSAEQPKVLHIGTIDAMGNEILVDIGIPGPRQLYTDNWDDLEYYVQNIDPFKLQGVILFSYGKRPFKILNKKYQKYLEARGNQLSIPFRYIQVRGTSMESLLIELYPEYLNKFAEYEDSIQKVAKNIHEIYIKRFIKHEFIQTDPLSHRIIKEAHGRHIADRGFKVTLGVILEIMKETKFVHVVNQIIKNLKKNVNENAAAF